MNRMHRETYLFLVVLMLVGCTSDKPTPKPVPVGTLCQEAQKTLDRLECTFRQSAKGTPFVVVCENAAKEGINLAPRCVADAASCIEAKACRP